jgi:exodeoxyribonuclease-5
MVSLSAPVVSLTKIRRFDENSGIGFICAHLRKANSFPRVKKEGLTMIRKSEPMTLKFHQENEFDVVICGTNKTRKKLNELIRSAKGFYEDTPEIGEVVVCLRNDVVSNTKISNGERFKISGIMKLSNDENRYNLQSLDRDVNVWVTVANETWITERVPEKYSRDSGMNQFGFGYALSSHRCQGSSFEKVLFIDEDVSYFIDQRRYRYTGCSRAMTHLTVAI